MTKAEQRALEAANLALITTLDSALNELRDVLMYKDPHLAKKHKDYETLEELCETLNELKKGGAEILTHIQADAIEELHFPALLRKMWSGHEVQEWLQSQANHKRYPNKRDNDEQSNSSEPE